MPDSSLPQRMPGQGNCPPGYRPTTFQGQQPGSSACAPIGPGVPAGGWKPAKPGGGAGYPPSFDAFKAAADDATFPGSTGAMDRYGSDYADWIRRMAGR